jgi:protein-disulfide isomerase
MAGLISSIIVGVGWAETGVDDSQVVAEIGNQKITLGQVRQKEPSRVLAGENAYYQAEREAIVKVLDDQLLLNEAHRQNLSVDELYKREVKDRVKVPTEAQLRFFYDALGAPESFESMRQKILDHIVQTQEKKLLASYLVSLRGKENARILLQPPKFDIVLGKAPIIGPKDAPVTIVEFADFECPYCRQTEPNLEKVRDQFPAKLRIVYKNFPLPMHSHAQKAAEAGLCAAEQGKFWPYHDKLMSETPPKLEVPQLKALAGSLHLDTARFDQCLDSGREAATVDQDVAQGKSLGVNGTPSFFINGHFLSGAVQYNTLRDMVDEQLASSKTANSGTGMQQSSAR